MASSVIPVPTLGTQGWVRDPVAKFDFLLSHFFLADYNQTYLYPGYVSSLPAVMEKHGSNMTAVIEEIKGALSNYLNHYYDSVEVTVQPTIALDINPNNAIELKVSIGVNDKGTASVFGRLLRGENAKIDAIVKLNNGD